MANRAAGKGLRSAPPSRCLVKRRDAEHPTFQDAGNGVIGVSRSRRGPRSPRNRFSSNVIAVRRGKGAGRDLILEVRGNSRKLEEDAEFGETPRGSTLIGRESNRSRLAAMARGEGRLRLIASPWFLRTGSLLVSPRLSPGPRESS